MEIAVLSDIHGNYIALERCLAYAFSKGIDTFFFLGDYVAELAYPERTMEILYNLSKEYKCYFIKGNKEEYWIKYLNDGEIGWKDNNSASGALLYAYNRLTKKDIDFFKQLQPVQEIAIKNMQKILICHGSPYGVSEKMLPDNLRTTEIMDSVNNSVILCGHTHEQRKIEHKGKCVINPGSVGLPLHSGGRTQFLILHGNNNGWTEEFLSLDYDIDRVIKELHEVGLYEHAPYWTLTTEYILRNGTMGHNMILSRAMELCREEKGDCVWPEISEKYWAQAAAEVLEEVIVDTKEFS